MLVHTALPPQVEVERRMVELGGLRVFTKLAFRHIEPKAFIPNWHIDAMSEHLDAVTSGDIRNLIVNVPPGSMKSIQCGVAWPAHSWCPHIDPGFKTISSAYSPKLAHRDAVRTRDLINSPWYQARWGFKLHPDTGRPLEDQPNFDGVGTCIPWQNARAASFYENNHKGFRFATSVGGEVTGRHGDVLVIDDPNKAQAASGGRAATGVELQTAIDFWSETMSSRLANPKTGRKVIIMQRLHENDLAGAMLETGDYVHLCLPMEFDPPRKCFTQIGWQDPRTTEGELLWPERFGTDEVATLKKAMGSTTAAAQLDQNPTPAGGAIFKREYLLKEWEALPARCQFFQSWDCTFKDEDTSDWVVGQAWARFRGEFFLVDQRRDRMDFPATLQAVKDFKAKWPKTTGIYIEDKANGTGIISTLKKQIPGIIPVNPQGGKVVRAQAVSPYFEAGNVYLPKPKVAPWVGEWREEMVKFPRAKNDDMVDSTTQALIQLAGHSGDRFKSAMDAIKAKR